MHKKPFIDNVVLSNLDRYLMNPYFMITYYILVLCLNNIKHIPINLKVYYHVGICSK